MRAGTSGTPSSDGAPRLLRLAWPGLSDVLPDGGLPQGSVIELASPGALGGATSLALAAVRAGQEGAGAWCAWIDPEATLYAPGVAAARVDLGRMLVVRPPRGELARIAVKAVDSGAFEVVVVDYDAVPGAGGEGARAKKGAGARRGWAPEVLVRKLALKAEDRGTTVILLTDSSRPRALPWPVALRLDLARPSRHEMAIRVAKDRRGRIGLAKTLPFQPTMAAGGGR